MIPATSNFPNDFDGDGNLYAVHDALRLRLAEDYNPGDASVNVEGDAVALANWPATGLVTLTEQCGELDQRALSFYYAAFDPVAMTFSGLELLPGFTDVKKPKHITNVTMNVMDRHHNGIIDAVVAIQKMSGLKGTVDNRPLGDTLEGRINFLRAITLVPKAWFVSDVRTGNVPLAVEFENRSFHLATDGTTDGVTVTWDFGDHTSSTVSITSVISADSLVPDAPVDVLVRDVDGGKIKKVYHQPGVYDVKLTVTNKFGEDVCVFPSYVNARIKAPDNAVVRFVENTSSQVATPGVPPNGPFETPPTIRSPVNALVHIEVDVGENPATPGVSFAGEALNDLGDPVDPVTHWTWSLGDDLLHPNSRVTTASYSVGGIYDMKLRVDTQFNAFRITSYDGAIDVVENQNLWLWTFQDAQTVRAYEYGLISETFKLTAAPTLAVNRNSSFLNSLANADQQVREFNRNVGFAPRSNTPSGNGGTALLYYASGRNASDPASSEAIRVVEFDGFHGTYINQPSIARPWNWAGFHSPQGSAFVFGTVAAYGPNVSPTNAVKQSLEFGTLTTSSATLTNDNYLNGAAELAQNVSLYDQSGASIYGNFSVYRTAWKDNTGYLLRNDGVGPFFRVKNFYQTEGTAGTPFVNIRKLADMQGPTKQEGQLVPLSAGIYFMNNSGSVSVFNTTDNAWHTGGPGVNSLLYRGLQDTGVVGYDDPANTLVAASDADKRAYLSFDYSANAFLRFNETDLTFASLGGRPGGSQWLLGIY